jgi:hypothetical protein
MSDAFQQRAMAGITSLGVAPDDEEGLYRLLGARMKLLQRDPSVAGDFAPAMASPAELGITGADVLEFGREVFLRIAAIGQPLICGTEGGQGFYLQRILATLNTNPAAVTTAITTMLVAHLAIAPVIAGVVATIIVGKVAPTSLAALCHTWGAKLSPDGTGTTPPAPPAVPTMPPAPPAVPTTPPAPPTAGDPGVPPAPPAVSTPPAPPAEPTTPPAEPPAPPTGPPGNPPAPPVDLSTPPSTPPAEPPGNPPAPPTPPDEPTGNPPPPPGGAPGNPPTT